MTNPQARYKGLLRSLGARGYWPCDEVTGSTAYDHANRGQPGTWTGSPTLGNARFIDNTPATTLDGSNDYVALASTASAFNFNAQTMCGWALLGASGLTRAIMSKGYQGMYVRTSAAGAIEALFSQSASLGTWTRPADGRWHFYAFTHPASGAVRLWLDARNMGPTGSTNAFGGGTKDMKIGGETDVSSILQDVSNHTLWGWALFDRELTGNQVRQLYETLRPAKRRAA